MTRTDFRTLFLRALNLAADNTEARLADQVPRSFLVELHGAGRTGAAIIVDESLNNIWLGGDRFYRVINLAVTQVLPDATVVFARVSNHPPAPFGQTFDPTGLGPFKQIVAEHVIDRRVHTG